MRKSKPKLVMRIAGVLLALVVMVLVMPRRSVAQDIRPRLLAQARAADAVGDVLFQANAQAESRLDDLRRSLQDARHFAGARPVASQPATQSNGTPPLLNPGRAGEKPPTYRDLFDHAVKQVQGNHQRTTDPSFDNLTDDDLFQEMTSLQLYNLRQFMRLGTLRHQAEALERRSNLASDEKGTAATHPAVASFEDLLARVDARIAAPQRSPEWLKLRRKLHNVVTARMEPQSFAPGVTQSNPAQAYAPAPLPGPLDDPRFQPWYYGPQDPFTGWVDPFADPFRITGGGGFYNRSDTRVNIDPDTRTNSVFDRRVNIDNDRRLNVHEDPRQNF
jgi:hypothetical protein